MSVSPLEYLRHILDEIKYLHDRAKALSKEDFLNDETLKRAFVRSIEIIGEAAKKIPAFVIATAALAGAAAELYRSVLIGWIYET